MARLQRLGLSVGRPGPHDFAVRTGLARLARPARPSHPALHVRDDAYAPPMSAAKHSFLKNRIEKFSPDLLTGESTEEAY